MATYKQASVYRQQERGITEYLPWIVGGGIALGVAGFIIYLALTPPPPPPTKKAYTVTVEAIDASTGNPVQGASVTLDSYSTSTDSTGIAVLSDVPAGSYMLTVNATGYQTYTTSETITQDTAVTVQLTPTTPPPPPPPSSITPVAKVIDPTTGAYLDSDTIQVGQEMKISTTVPSSTDPVSVQAVINGTPASVHPWSVAQTGYNYIIDFGPAPNKPGNYTVYTKVTFADGSVANSNTVQIQIVSTTAPSGITYNVSVSASPSSNIPVNSDVTFYVKVTASDGSIPTGTATLYVNHANGTNWGTWPLTLLNGSASITLQPGLYLSPGETYMTYYAVYQGFQSPTGTITFQTSIQPTSITLSASTTSPAPNTIVTFDVVTDGSNVAGTLYAYNSLANAQNAPSLTGQLARYPIAIGPNGSGSISLYPTELAATTYWVAIIGNVRSNIVQVTEQQVPITSMSMCAKPTGYEGDVEFVVTTNAGGEGTAYLTGYSYDPSTGAVGGIIWGPEPYFQVVNGSAHTTIVPGMVATNTAWRASSGSVLSNFVYVENASASNPGAINPTC